MKTGLAFSGGRDSWACLWLNRDRLDQIAVIWVNPGKHVPELLATIEKARAMCPHFYEVKTDRDEQNRVHGIPADVVPINWTVLGQSCTGEKPVLIQSYLQCCFENISGPLHRKALELGLSELIRGQRLEDRHKGTARDGDVVEGIRYLHPIENWTKDQVTQFVARQMELPGHFSLEHSSVDCFDCTAYRKESNDKIVWLAKTHPRLYGEYINRALDLGNAILEASR